MNRNPHALFHFAASNSARCRLIEVAPPEWLIRQCAQQTWAHQALPMIGTPGALILISAERLLQQLKVPLDDGFFQADLEQRLEMLIRRVGVYLRKKIDGLLWRFGRDKEFRCKSGQTIRSSRQTCRLCHRFSSLLVIPYLEVQVDRQQKRQSPFLRVVMHPFFEQPVAFFWEHDKCAEG